MKGYLTAREVAEKWGVTVRCVQKLCEEEKIKGVTKFGNAWAIPSDAKKPADGRITTGEYKKWRERYGKKT